MRSSCKNLFEEFSHEVLYKEFPKNYDEGLYQDFGLQPPEIELQIGYSLIPLVDKYLGAELLHRLRNIKNQIDAKTGIILAPIKIRDNMALRPSEYEILINGTIMGKFDLQGIDFFLCLKTKDSKGEIDGIKTKDPVYGQEAYFVLKEDKQDQENAGYLCISAECVIATHLHEIIRKNLTKFLNQCMVNQLTEKVRISNPDVYTDVFFHHQFTVSKMKILLNSLLEENVSIRDMNTIMEAIADYYNCIKNSDNEPWDLLLHVRERLAYSFIKKYEDDDFVLHVIKISDSLSIILLENAIYPCHVLEPPFIALDPEMRKKVEPQLIESIKKVLDKGYQPVILCDRLLRHPLATLLHQSMPGVAVISHTEIMALKGECVIESEEEVTIGEERL